MNGKRRFAGRVLVMAGIALAVLLFVQGCKDEPAAQKQSTQAQARGHSETDGHAHAAAEDMVETAQETVEATATKVVAAMEQTTCPVMAGSPINEALFVEYEGKNVYFCCKGCEGKFLADPAQYVAKLPQFKK